ncbi:MAG: hypothetical protein WC570_04095 [Patescibacteria group bacterium]
MFRKSISNIGEDKNGHDKLPAIFGAGALQLAQKEQIKESRELDQFLSSVLGIESIVPIAKYLATQLREKGEMDIELFPADYNRDFGEKILAGAKAFQQFSIITDSIKFLGKQILSNPELFYEINNYYQERGIDIDLESELGKNRGALNTVLGKPQTTAEQLINQLEFYPGENIDVRVKTFLIENYQKIYDQARNHWVKDVKERIVKSDKVDFTNAKHNAEKYFTQFSNIANNKKIKKMDDGEFINLMRKLYSRFYTNPSYEWKDKEIDEMILKEMNVVETYDMKNRSIDKKSQKEIDELVDFGENYNAPLWRKAFMTNDENAIRMLRKNYQDTGFVDVNGRVMTIGQILTSMSPGLAEKLTKKYYDNAEKYMENVIADYADNNPKLHEELLKAFDQEAVKYHLLKEVGDIEKSGAGKTAHIIKFK